MLLSAPYVAEDDGHHPFLEQPQRVGTASPGDGGAVGGALPSGSPEAYDRTTSYSSRSDQHGPNGPMTA